MSNHDDIIGTNDIIHLAQLYFMVVLSLESAEIQQLKQKHKANLQNNKQYWFLLVVITPSARITHMLQAFQREVTGQKTKKTIDQKSSSHPIKSLASTRCARTLDLDLMVKTLRRTKPRGPLFMCLWGDLNEDIVKTSSMYLWILTGPELPTSLKRFFFSKKRFFKKNPNHHEASRATFFPTP